MRALDRPAQKKDKKAGAGEEEEVAMENQIGNMTFLFPSDEKYKNERRRNDLLLGANEI